MLNSSLQPPLTELQGKIALYLVEQEEAEAYGINAFDIAEYIGGNSVECKYVTCLLWHDVYVR